MPFFDWSPIDMQVNFFLLFFFSAMRLTFLMCFYGLIVGDSCERISVPMVMALRRGERCSVSGDSIPLFFEGSRVRRCRGITRGSSYFCIAMALFDGLLASLI